MRGNIQLLMMGDASVAANFQRAKDHWAGLLEDIDTVRLSVLADRLTSQQGWFEDHCGSTRHDGQEVMVWTAFAYLMSSADGVEALTITGVKLLEAFKASSCSGEVIADAVLVARYYYIEND
ncbi:hypothetical protein [Duganella sp. HH105]|uniref:hypothetical protein n=1 Tax=Duganella sp. HH105 TaxID=1781067 RepID=UPI000877C038|nr:hypothetical protein [Duganella sp. HH105]